MKLCRLTTAVVLVLLLVDSKAQEIEWDSKNQARHCELPGNDLKYFDDTRLVDCKFIF